MRVSAIANLCATFSNTVLAWSDSGTREQLTDSRRSSAPWKPKPRGLGGIEPDPERAYVRELVTDLKVKPGKSRASRERAAQ